MQIVTLVFRSCRELAKQGETIERTQRKVDEVDANADKARSILWSMKSVFHTMGSKFKKKPKDPEAAAEEAAAVRAARRAKQAQAAGKPAPDPATLSAPKRGGGGSASAADASASRAVAAPGTIAGMQQEQDQLLEIISGNVDRIGQMGRQMGDELTRQDAMLDDLITGVGKVDIKLKDNAKEARRQAR